MGTGRSRRRPYNSGGCIVIGRDLPATPPNNPINPSVVPVTRLACARRAPVPPAGYRERWADNQ
jgi:hypothetical protein